MSRLSTDDEQRQTTEHEDRARILEAEFAIVFRNFSQEDFEKFSFLSACYFFVTLPIFGDAPTFSTLC